MNELGQSGQGQEESKISSYEGEQYLPYAELGKGEDFDIFGSVVVTNEDGTKEWKSYYGNQAVTKRLFTDPILAQADIQEDSQVVLVDFGGGDGIMLEQVNDQLSQKGFNVEPILLDMDEKKLEQAKQNRPNIRPIVGDLAKMPLLENSVDIGISRMAMQYLPRPFDRTEPLPKWLPVNYAIVRKQFEKDGYINQYDVLKEMYRVMKPDHTLVLVWPGAYKYATEEEKKRSDNISFFWNRITAAKELSQPHGRLMDEDFVSLERWFTAGEEMAQFAQKAGFDVEDGGEVDWIEYRITAKSVQNRFDPKGTWSDNIRQYLEEDFETADSKYQRGEGLDIIKWHDKNAVRLPVSRLVLRKPKLANNE